MATIYRYWVALLVVLGTALTVPGFHHPDQVQQLLLETAVRTAEEAELWEGKLHSRLRAGQPGGLERAQAYLWANELRMGALGHYAVTGRLPVTYAELDPYLLHRLLDTQGTQRQCAPWPQPEQVLPAGSFAVRFTASGCDLAIAAESPESSHAVYYGQADTQLLLDALVRESQELEGFWGPGLHVAPSEAFANGWFKSGPEFPLLLRHTLLQPVLQQLADNYAQMHGQVPADFAMVLHTFMLDPVAYRLAAMETDRQPFEDGIRIEVTPDRSWLRFGSSRASSQGFRDWRFLHYRWDFDHSSGFAKGQGVMNGSVPTSLTWHEAGRLLIAPPAMASASPPVWKEPASAPASTPLASGIPYR